MNGEKYFSYNGDQMPGSAFFYINKKENWFCYWNR